MGTVYSNSGGKYLFMLESNTWNKETIFYSSITNTFHKASFPDGVTGTGKTTDYLACLNKSNGAYFFDANDGSLTTLSYPMQIDGLSNVAAVTYDENTNTGYGYNASTKTWTQIPIVGNLNLPPQIVEYVGIVPVDSRKGFYAYSAKHDYWGSIYSDDYKAAFIGENIACIRKKENKTLYAFYPDAVIGVEEENYDLGLTNFKLNQNYPNPFNPSANIQYAIGSRQFVTLKAYDILGKEVAVLVKEEKRAGEYEVQFDGTGLSSGIYFYQLKAGDYLETKKMILLK
jgi:hypothetical protein